jgi:hypothetical protein
LIRYTLEVAKSLKFHPFTVTRLAREGKLPAFKVGGSCLPARLCGGALSEG